MVRGSHGGDSRSGARCSESGRYKGSGVEMGGIAERYWKELRPTHAGRFRLDVSIRHTQDDREPDRRRPRPHLRPRRRSTSR
jgi:hypothetical protein